MKAYIALIALTGALALASCGGDDDNETAAPPAEEVVGGTNHSVLIAYFSEPLPDNGVDAATSASRLTIDGTTYGSVQFVASIIQEATGGDMIRIQTATPYPTDYTSLAAQADTERRDGIHHELATEIENFADYDVVFVGYPIWWYQLPMPLYSFFDKFDFAGKTIIPFSTHGGNGWSGTVTAISQMEPEATMATGYSISRNSVARAADDIRAWLQRIGMAE